MTRTGEFGAPHFDCVQDKISEQLLQTLAVPDIITFPLYRQIKLTIRMYRAKLVELIADYGSEVHASRNYVDAQT
jgi:hypothetical protein